MKGSTSRRWASGSHNRSRCASSHLLPPAHLRGGAIAARRCTVRRAPRIPILLPARPYFTGEGSLRASEATVGGGRPPPVALPDDQIYIGFHHSPPSSTGRIL